MVTTKKANAPAAPAVEKEWEDSAQASGGGESDAPAWVPQWSVFHPDEVADKMTTIPPGSSMEKVLIGKLSIHPAFGEPRYFVDCDSGADKGKRMALPLHGSLTSSLDKIAIEGGPRVRIGYAGKAKKARRGQNAAFLYDIRVQPKEALLAEARKDALLPIHKANKAKRDAAKAAEDASGDDIDE